VSFREQGTNYVHAVFMDEVGNVSDIVTSNATIYDNVAPQVTGVSINHSDDYTNSTDATVRVYFSDATSGVGSLLLTGDITENQRIDLNDSDRANGYKDCNITLTSGDGLKTVSATALDLADNGSGAGINASDSITLDTGSASGTLTLRKADDSANLPPYVNDTEFAAVIATSDTDVVYYKIWGDIDGATTEPDNWSSTSFTSGRMLIDDLDLSSGEGTKTINVKIMDRAGNITTLTPKTVVYDTTAPTVTLSADKSVISDKDGFDTVTFTYSATDTNTLSNTTYELKLGNTVIKSGTFTDGKTEAVTEAEIVAISAGQGSKSFVLYVTDRAGNVGYSSTVNIVVDLTAPTGSVTANSYYTSSSVNVTIAGTDTGGATLSKMKVWLDDTEPSSWETYTAGSKTITGVSENQHIAHVRFQDSVGNTSTVYDSATFIVDATAPSGTLSIASYTNTRSVTVNISASDAKGSAITSGLDKMKIWENGTTEPASWETYAATKSLTLTTGDGSKTINAKFKDKAGNETSTVAATCSTILDTDEPDVTLVLTESDGSTTLPAHVNVTGFCARVGFTNETQNSPITHYKLTGDFTDSSEDWIEFVADSGKSYMTISDLNLTSTNGTKTMTAWLKDAAGNISATSASASVVYDSSAPVIEITTNPDYNRVSKEHTPRHDNTGAAITGKYNDMCTFTWSANEAL
jgi:hypothetical protein